MRWWTALVFPTSELEHAERLAVRSAERFCSGVTILEIFVAFPLTFLASASLTQSLYLAVALMFAAVIVVPAIVTRVVSAAIGRSGLPLIAKTWLRGLFTIFVLAVVIVASLLVLHPTFTTVTVTPTHP